MSELKCPRCGEVIESTKILEIGDVVMLNSHLYLEPKILMTVVDITPHVSKDVSLSKIALNYFYDGRLMTIEVPHASLTKYSPEAG